jgi:hypothetical protein
MVAQATMLVHSSFFVENAEELCFFALRRKGARTLTNTHTTYQQKNKKHNSANFTNASLFLTAAKANTLNIVESEIKTVAEASNKSLLISQSIQDLSVPKETRVKKKVR